MDNGACSYRRFLGGDDKGIAEIVGDYKDGLILYLNGYVNNIHIAEELAEDTFFRLVVKKPKFSGKSTFKTWLYAIGRNVAADYLRHSSKSAGIPIDDAENILQKKKVLSKAILRKNVNYHCTKRFHIFPRTIKAFFGSFISRAFQTKKPPSY